MDAYRHVVVTVAGAGEAKPGDTLRALAAALPGPPGSYHRSDLVLGQAVYPRLVNSAPSLPDLIEVEWSDLPLRPRSPGAWLRWLCALVVGLPRVLFEWCPAAPAPGVGPALRDVVACACLWTLWPVLLTLVHAVVAPTARSQAALLDAAALLALAWLARSQWRPGNRATPAGYVWLGLSAVVSAALWLVPGWTGQLALLSSRVYGLGLLTLALVVLAYAAEVTVRALRGTVTWRCGLAGLLTAMVPLALVSALGSCFWGVVLNLIPALGSGPQLEAFKGWQQTYARGLGFHLASGEWALAGGTGIVGLLWLGGVIHVAVTGRGGALRGWLSAGRVAIVVLCGLAAASLLLTSPYLRAPLAPAVKLVGAGADPRSVYTWSVLRLLPWVVLLFTPARRLLALLGDASFYVMSPEAGDPSTRQACQERLRRLLEFLDRGRYDRIHVVAHRQGAVVALDVLRGATWRHPLVFTTLGSPAASFYRDVLDWPLDPAALAPAEWSNLYSADDMVGGPVGVAAIDVVLAPGEAAGYWATEALAARVVQAMQAPLPAARD